MTADDLIGGFLGACRTRSEVLSDWNRETLQAVETVSERCGLVQVCRGGKAGKSEFWTIDCALFFPSDYSCLPDPGVYKSKKGSILCARPVALIEIENETAHWKILYDLWRLSALRASIRAIVAYPRGGAQEFANEARDVFSRVAREKSPLEGEIEMVLGKSDACSLATAQYEWWTLGPGAKVVRHP